MRKAQTSKAMSLIPIIYTDGSCHTQLRTGAWAALLFIGDKKIILKGVAEDTTHNRMELQSVIESLNYLQLHFPEFKTIKIISDSQYVVHLRERKEKLIFKNFKTKAGKEIQNVDLVKKLFDFDDDLMVEYEKIKAHQQKVERVENFNIEVDAIVRNLLRTKISA